MTSRVAQLRLQLLDQASGPAKRLGPRSVSWSATFQARSQWRGWCEESRQPARPPSTEGRGGWSVYRTAQRHAHHVRSISNCTIPRQRTGSCPSIGNRPDWQAQGGTEIRAKHCKVARRVIQATGGRGSRHRTKSSIFRVEQPVGDCVVSNGDTRRDGENRCANASYASGSCEACAAWSWCWRWFLVGCCKCCGWWVCRRFHADAPCRKSIEL